MKHVATLCVRVALVALGIGATVGARVERNMLGHV